MRAIAGGSRGLPHQRFTRAAPKHDLPSGPTPGLKGLDDACTRRCEACSQPFVTKLNSHRFCSPKCRWRAANSRHRIPPGVDRRLVEFFAAVAARVDARRDGGSTVEAPDSRSIAEAQAELVDSAAYSFVAWCRLEQLQQQAEPQGDKGARPPGSRSA